MSDNPNATSQADLVQRWQAAWPLALACWSKYTRLHEPQLCRTHLEASEAGLQNSFAMIRLRDQRVVVNLQRVVELGLEAYALEILAHEIGHHVLAPACVTDHLSLLARIRSGLPTLTQHTPMVANLYADLMVNDRLQRQSNLRIASIYQCLAKQGSAQTPGSALWRLYLRICAHLWQSDAQAFGLTTHDERMAADAWLGARLVRVYAKDWLQGAARFAALVLPYLFEDAQSATQASTHAVTHAAIHPLLDTTEAAAGSEPYGGIEIAPQEREGLMHPVHDPAITGEDAQPAHDLAADRATVQPAVQHGLQQCREPFEYGEILRAAGLNWSDHDVAVRYYRERALPYMVPFVARARPNAPEPLLEGLEPWDLGQPLDALDVLQTVLQSPRMVPGLSTVQRVHGQQPSTAVERRVLDLDLYVDSSGSMPNPQTELSYLSLAGAIIALSALRAGSAVQATLWSGKNQFMHTDGFIRDEQDILRVLTGFYGGATCFPIHRLRHTYSQDKPRNRAAHILMISDDGITTLFDQDEQGHSGWDIASQALRTAGGGGTMALNVPANWEAAALRANASFAMLQRAQKAQGWRIFAISQLQDLIGFAQAFSRQHYT